MNRLSYLLLALLLGLIACTPDQNPLDPNNPDNNGNPNNPIADAPSQDEISAIAPAFTTPAQIIISREDLVEAAAGAVYQASISANTGQLVTTGTLEILNQNGNISYQYQPTPTDRLRVLGAEGGEWNMTYTVVEGYLQGSLQDYLDRNHRLIFRVVGENETDLQVTAIRDGANRALRYEGTYPAEDGLYTMDIDISGTEFFEVDNTGSSFRTSMRYTGTLNRADGLTETLDETWNYESVYASGAFFAENMSRRTNSAWEIEGQRYKWDDAYFQMVFRDGRPTEYNASNSPWTADGQLLRNGAAFGQLEWGLAQTAFLHIWLIPENGEERISLSNWRLN